MRQIRILICCIFVAMPVAACGGSGAGAGSETTSSSKGIGAGSETTSSSKGIVYKPATTEINTKGEAFIREVLGSAEKAQELAKKSPLICGPGLWVQMRNHPDVTVIKTGQTSMIFQTANGMQKFEGKMFQSEDEVQRFWRALFSTITVSPFTVRKLNEREKEIYWAMITWDIEEPIFVIEGPGYELLVDLVVEDGGGFQVFWVDDVSKIGFKRTRE